MRSIHERGTQTLRFSPDNRLIATAGRLDGLLQVVDVESGRTLRTLAPATAPQDSGHRRVLFAANGSIVAGADDGSVRIWDPATGQLRREFAKAIPGLQDFTLGADGRSVVAAANGAVQIWSLETGTRTAAFPDLASAVFSIALHPSGTVALAGGNDGRVTAIDLVRQAKLWQAAGHRGQVSSLAFAPDGQTAASGGADGMVRLWRAGTGEPLRTIPSENNRVRVLAFVANGTKLLAGGVWRTRMFDLADATLPVREFGGSEGITDLHVRGDGRYFATSDGGAGRVRLWDLAADSRSDHWRAHEARVSSLDVADQGRKIVSISTDAIRVWEPGRASALYEIPAPVPLGLAASNGGQWLAVVGRNESSVWDSRTGSRIATLPDATIARMVRFSDDGRRIYIGQNDGALATWEWRDGVATGPRRVPSEKAAVFSLATRGRRVFIAHSNRTVTEIDVDGAREARKFRTSSTVNVLALSPDGRRLAAGTFLGIVYLWDLETGRETQLKAHTRVVAGCDFSHASASCPTAGVSRSATRTANWRSATCSISSATSPATPSTTSSSSPAPASRFREETRCSSGADRS